MAGVAGDRGRGAGQALRQACQGLYPGAVPVRHPAEAVTRCLLCPRASLDVLVGAFRAAGARVTESVLSGRPR